MFLSLVDIGKTVFICLVLLKIKKALEAYLYALMSYRFDIPVSRYPYLLVCLPDCPSVCLSIYLHIDVYKIYIPGHTGDSSIQCFCHISKNFSLLLHLRSFFTRLKFAVYRDNFFKIYFFPNSLY